MEFKSQVECRSLVSGLVARPLSAWRVEGASAIDFHLSGRHDRRHLPARPTPESEERMNGMAHTTGKKDV